MKKQPPQQFRPKTWEQFKEEMEYFLSLLKQENLTDETKREINEAMQIAIRHWANPVVIVPYGSVIEY